MRFLTVASAFATAVSAAPGLYKGFNVAAENPDGSCKTQADWRTAFEKLASLPGHFTSVRLYSSGDCNQLANAVPVALSTGTTILVGVWTEDDAKFQREKDALEAAIKQYGTGWILAVSVGSEDLYRKEANPNRLAEQIYDVRGMIRALGSNADVGHVDTWTAWVDGANANVIKAVDFVGHDGYPYFEGSTIENSRNVFYESLRKTREAAQAIKPGVKVWVTETSWPASGNNFGAAVPSVRNAEKYWKDVACSLFPDVTTFWYAYQDYRSNPSFGIIGQNGQPVHDVTC